MKENKKSKFAFNGTCSECDHFIWLHPYKKVYYAKGMCYLDRENYNEGVIIPCADDGCTMAAEPCTGTGTPLE